MRCAAELLYDPEDEQTQRDPYPIYIRLSAPLTRGWESLPVAGRGTAWA